MSDMERFRRAVVEWAAGGVGASAAGEAARELAVGVGLRTVVLVEGGSDQVAVEALASRRGRDLDSEGVSVVPLGGATSVGRFVDLCGPQGLGVRLAGLCDVGEERFFRRALERAGLGSDIPPEGLEAFGFYVCDVDLEDELIRALGAGVVQRVVVDQGESRPFRTFQNQPAQRERTVEQQLRRFLGTHSGRKAQYAREMVESLDLERTPRPLDRLLAHV
ncbi:TOPRIM nucleotidyl transferase/hydrolase domain-containing protein [Streptomyces sp. NBC_00878]|uniref:TOPRIM nucleotidyl transferase/hydrolase domain-containing protein n=1 Tax=Streptomyces sp. NBC_00878 TaxID=2975854 RepID=UPI0022597108|nr:TOPRIM nucleotidyl transferase/hydrolase domain-containing protein [Streptomyces sp. NBC_00878]MCX4904411.1 ATP-dependent endonuclease [Streptomyces sp. NBC_00878]